MEFHERVTGISIAGSPLKVGDNRAPSAVHLLTRDDELSMLLDARGACWESHGKNNEALVAYAQAHRLSPGCVNHTAAIARVMPKITPFFGHTAPMLAPDYSQRSDTGMELTRSNAEWDESEREYFSRLPPAKTVAEQNERLRQRNEFQRRRIETQNEILVREELQRIYASPATQGERPRP